MKTILAKDYQAQVGVVATTPCYALLDSVRATSSVPLLADSVNAYDNVVSVANEGIGSGPQGQSEVGSEGESRSGSGSGGTPQVALPPRIKQIDYKKAHEWNTKELGYGIFLAVNGFKPPKLDMVIVRKKEHVARVNAWFVEMDDRPKPEQMELIRRSPLIPTMIIESKRGYHVYWVTSSTSLQELIISWDRIVKRGLIPHFNADKKAGDITRILRAPGFYHWKDRDDPFLVKRIHSSRAMYTIQQMLSAFPDLSEKGRFDRSLKKLIKLNPQGDDLWSRASSLDCEYALNRLSGSHYVNGDTYSFLDNRNGTMQIISNGKPTSCWIDENKRIGSYEDGGPTICQWLNWYHNDYGKVAVILKEVFPECLPLQMTLI